MTKPRHILIVGGEPEQRVALMQGLQNGGSFRVTGADSAQEALSRAQLHGQCVDAIVADSVLPDADACDLCAGLRRRGVWAPIIVLSEYPSENEVVRTLNAGANDYVARPFRMGELAARLRAQIREHDTSEDAILLVGPYHFHPGARQLHDPAANVKLRLTQKEVTILKCLYRAAGQPVSRQTLLREVWGYNSMARTHTVETHIYRLRRKIEPDPSHPTVVVNDGGGYSLGDSGQREEPPRPAVQMALEAAK